MEDFTNTTNTIAPSLLGAIATWLKINASSIRLMHVNGYKLETDGGQPVRKLFSSRMLDVYGTSAVPKPYRNTNANLAGSYVYKYTHTHEQVWS